MTENITGKDRSDDYKRFAGIDKEYNFDKTLHAKPSENSRKKPNGS